MSAKNPFSVPTNVPAVTLSSGPEQGGPKFVHDCDRCTFLGGATCPETQAEADLYYCPNPCFEGTIIARWSSEGDNYSSGLCFGRPGTILGIAKERAAARGFDVRMFPEREEEAREAKRLRALERSR